MVERITALNVYSLSNTWLDIIIIIEDDSEIDRAEEVIEAAYNEWFTTETGDTMTISEYIDEALNKEEINHTIYFNNIEED